MEPRHRLVPPTASPRLRRLARELADFVDAGLLDASTAERLLAERFRPGTAAGVWASAAHDNPASHRVLEKLGFEPVGKLAIEMTPDLTFPSIHMIRRQQGSPARGGEPHRKETT